MLRVSANNLVTTGSYNLGLEGILLTMVDQRNNLSRQVAQEVREHFGVDAYETEIPRNVRLSEAPSHGKPVLLYDIHSKGAISYLRLADEILRRYPPEVERFPAENGAGCHESALHGRPDAFAHVPGGKSC